MTRATPPRLEHLLDDNENDAVLVMNVPTALASAADAAKSVIAVTERHRKKRTPAKPVFAMWVGEGDPVADAFEAANIPNYATETAAIYGFTHLAQYRESRDLLMATPPNLPQDFTPDVAAVRPIIDGVLRDNRTWLDPVELSRVFSAYEIPITPGGAGARSRRGGRGGEAEPGRRRPRRPQDSIARHRAQIGGRRRAAQSRHRAGRARGGGGDSKTRAGGEARRAHHRRCRVSR